MSNKILYSIIIILFVVMPVSLLSAIVHFISDKLSQLIGKMKNESQKTLVPQMQQ